MKICQTKNQLKNYKPIIEKSEKRKVHSPFIDNIWGADLAGIQLISKFNKGIRFSLCVIDIFSKYAWVIPLKDKKGITITNDLKNSQTNLTANQTKYRYIKEVNFTIDQWKHGQKKKPKKCIQHIMKKDLLLLKDLLEL